MISTATHRTPAFGEDRRVLVVDAAVVTALGDSPEALWQRIMAGETAIRPIERFPVDGYPAKVAACIDNLKPADGRSMLYALLNRLLNGIEPVPSDAVLITATTKAGIDNLELLRRGKPADFEDILPDSVSETVCRKLGLSASGININAACASSTIAVAHGAALIASGRAEAVLICCADLVSEFVFAGFSALKALSPVPCRPFDRNRLGLSLGEGAAVLQLMSAARAQREKRGRLGTILGWGIANDASHITAPARSGLGLIQAVAQALKAAGRNAEDVAAVNAHGTGTIYNDLMELTAFRNLFGERNVPLYSVKGAIGHTLGAAGGIEVVLGLNALATQTVPPTVGLMEPMDGASMLVSREPRPFPGGCLLTTNSGFGGINAALILGA
jgi:3-oxoacyl-[acyl-carrier-protein] synthase II